MVAVGFLFNFRVLKPFPLPDHRKLLLISVLVLTALLFVNYFFIGEYFEEYIPDLPVKINIQALFIVAVLWVLFYIVFKRIVKRHDNISVAYLTIFGCLIVLFSELIFQTFRVGEMEYATNPERLKSFLLGILVTPALATFMAFSTALDLKIKNRVLITAINIGTGALLFFTAPYVLSFIKGE